MINTRMVLVVAAVSIAIGALLWNFRTRRTQAKAVDVPTVEWNSRWLRVEEKAKAAEAADPDAVRALADEVFGQPHLFGTLPASVKDSMEERVIEAELNYMNGRGRALTHNNVAQLINWLSDELSLSSYARTSEHQILDVRFRSLMFTPRFMGKGLSQREDGALLSVGESANPEMSPLQACYLAMFAIDLKLGNPDYQVAPDELETLRYQQTLSRWESYQRTQLLETGEPGTPVQQESHSKPTLVARSGSKHLELARAAEAHLLTLSPEESITLGQSALDALGIER